MVLCSSRSLPSLRLAPCSLGFSLGLTGVLSAVFWGPLCGIPTPSSCCTVLCISMLLRLFLSFPKDPSVKSKAMATYPTSCCSSFSSELRTSYIGLGKPLRASPLRRRAKRPRCPPRASVPWIVGTRSPVACGPTILFRAPGRERSPGQRGAWAARGDRRQPPPRPGLGMGGRVGPDRAVAWVPKAWEAVRPPVPLWLRFLESAPAALLYIG